MQPLDVGIFSPLKQAWRREVLAFQHDNIGMTVDKRTFSRVFRSAYNSTIKLSTIVNAFERSGLCPVNRNAITSKQLAPATVYKTSQAEPPASAHNTGSNLALAALEEACSEETLSVFKTRLEEGYDLEDDALYNTWG